MGPSLHGETNGGQPNSQCMESMQMILSVYIVILLTEATPISHDILTQAAAVMTSFWVD
jgi:hypothetical protein